MNGTSQRNSLQPGYRLHWYEIKSIIGTGGFGITYLATDQNLHRDVAIKEYLPNELAVRDDDSSIHPISDEHKELYTWGLDRFITEARTLAKFKHDNIVPVLAVFEENNTGYMVMNYEQGVSLQEKLTGKKTISEDELSALLFPLLDGLELIHSAGFIHRDLKPGNIYIREDGSPVLLDFGSARQALGEETKTLTTMVSPAYAPYEQYYSKSDEQGPWTDIFGMGATLYRAVTGITPLNSLDRSKAILEGIKDPYVSAQEVCIAGYSKAFLMAIDHALRFKYQDRPQSIKEWRLEFKIESTGRILNLYDKGEKTQVIKNDTTKTLELSTTNRSRRSVTKRPPEKKRTSNFFGKAMLLMLLGTGGYFLYLILGNDTDYASMGFVQAVKEVPEALTKSLNEMGRDLEARKEKRDKIEQLLSGAHEDIKMVRLVQPKGANALEKYAQVLALDSDNQKAINGKQRIFTYLIDAAEQALNAHALEDAELNFNHAALVDPDSERLKIGRAQLREEQAKKERLALAKEKEQFAKERELILQKQKEEAERKKQLELARQKQLQLERQAQEEERRRQEEERLKQAAYEKELEEARKAADERRKQQLEDTAKYNRLLFEAQQALNKNQLDIAVAKFEQSLALNPDGEEALLGLSHALELKGNCQQIIGRWEWFNGGITTFLTNGTVTGEHPELPENTGTWECKNPEARRFIVRWQEGGWVNRLTLSDDGMLLNGVNQEGTEVSGKRIK